MLPQIKNTQSHEGEVKKSPLEPSVGVALKAPWFQTPSNCERNISVALSHQDCGNLLQQI